MMTLCSVSSSSILRSPNVHQRIHFFAKFSLIFFSACSSLGVDVNVAGVFKSLEMVSKNCFASCPSKTGVAPIGSAMAFLLGNGFASLTRIITIFQEV